VRVLLSTIGSRGDVQPLVAFGIALRGLGQDARFCVPPDFCDAIERLGFAATPIGPELRASTPAPPSSGSVPLSPERRRQLAEASVVAQFDTIASAARECDAIVAATALQIAARSVSEKARIRYVFVAYSPNVLPSPHHAPPVLPPLPGQPLSSDAADYQTLWARDAERFDALFGRPLNASRAAIDLPPVTHVRDHVFTDEPWLAADATLAPWPPSSGVSVLQTGAWILEDDRPLPRALETFLDAGEPPVHFGFGSMRAAADTTTAMLASARACGRRVVVSRGWANLSVPSNDSDCIAVDDVNHQTLFRRVAAVVHHGGAGTTTAAALAGAPQVIVPHIYDQHYWAERVRALDVGAAHAPGQPTTGSLTAALSHALTPDVAARARLLSRSIARDGAQVAAERLISRT
jgi:vancomycin aglycone glucosyltransferase